MIFTNCLKCNKPLVNKENLIKLRYIILGSTGGGLILGCCLLPVLGFGLSGVGGLASMMQPSVIAAGSLFATLQSLGATGMGILLFGSIGSALGLLASITSTLNWCTCEKSD